MRMTIVGKGPQAGGSECIIFGYVAADDAFAPVTPAMRDGAGGTLSTHGGWEARDMLPADGVSTAPALVGWMAGEHFCRTTGRLILVAHQWSGQLQINDIGRKYTIDLYSPETRLVLLDVVNEILVDVTSLAATTDGALTLPKMSLDALIAHILDRDAWFRFLERDAAFAPGLARRAIEALRHRSGEKARLRLLSSLLPLIATRRAPSPPPTPLPAPPPPPPQEGGRLRDEL
ncbi:MAG: hypothetical protein KGM15_00495, partial [Pseudomonadota bacterium]|nr:hypothetical protein [Pseudomonadota bacterium]